MKTLLITGLLGMICFQSCTKENSVTPKTENQENLQTIKHANFQTITPVNTKSMIKKRLIKTYNMFPNLPENPYKTGTPIYVPEDPSSSF